MTDLRSNLVRGLLISLLVVAIAAVVLFVMGREPICKCGYVKLWHWEVMSSENSQHLIDWYTLSHILHGFIFYFLGWLARSKISLGWRLVIATVIEAAWEILENTDAVIERYREVTISLDYYGDSIVNSVSDMAMMIIGFFLARALPVWLTIVLFIAAEAITIWFIRDGLLLNILMLVWPLEAVRQWQAG